jgi:hypothetical protein
MDGESGLGYFTSHVADTAATGYNWFQKEKIENTWGRSEVVEIKPINSLSSGPIWFQLGSAESNYVIPMQ